MKSWKLLESKMAFDHRWFKVRQDKVELPNGKILDDYFVRVNEDVALVVPFTKEKKFVLVRQYKHGAGKLVVEFPAGYIGKGEAAEVGAERELREETGYMAGELRRLAVVTNDATKETAKVSLFLATNCSLDHDVEFDENEEIETFTVEPAELLEMIAKGEIEVTASVAAGMLALKELGVLS